MPFVDKSLFRNIIDFPNRSADFIFDNFSKTEGKLNNNDNKII